MSSSAASATTTLAQKASQEYADCRRKVTSIVEKIKHCDTEIENLFQELTRLQSLGEAKSVGSVQVSILHVEGVPITDQLIKIELECYSEEEQVVQEEESEEEDDTNNTKARKDSFAQKMYGNKTMTVDWNQDIVLPATILFDPVQSRDATISINILESGVVQEDTPLLAREFDFPLERLFDSEIVDEWLIVSENCDVQSEAKRDADTQDIAQDDAKDAKECQAGKNLRIHVQIEFLMSESEKVHVRAIELSKQKQEAEGHLSVLEREASALRSKYERLSGAQMAASQHRVAAASNQPIFTVYQKHQRPFLQRVQTFMASCLTPDRQYAALSFAMFFGSAALFHFHGDKLRA